MSAILLELLKHKPNIIEPKATQNLKDNYWKYVWGLVSFQNIKKPRPGDVIICGEKSKILKNLEKFANSMKPTFLKPLL